MSGYDSPRHGHQHYPELPPGTRVRVERVDLPAGKHTSPSDGTDLARERRRRANDARRAWRLVLLNERWTSSGPFVGVDYADAYAREQGWIVEDNRQEEVRDLGSLDHLRYIGDADYRSRMNEVVRQHRGVGGLAIVHEDDKLCCELERWEDTLVRIMGGLLERRGVRTPS